MVLHLIRAILSLRISKENITVCLSELHPCEQAVECLCADQRRHSCRDSQRLRVREVHNVSRRKWS